MKVTKCKNGHFYDAKKYKYCPHCGTQYEFDVILPRFLEKGTPSMIGRGSISEVFKISGEKNYALKVIKCSMNLNKYKNALYELEIMKHLNGLMNTIQMYDYECTEECGERTVYILEEYHTTLSDYLTGRDISVNNVMKIVIGVCNALLACRQAGILHLDIQPKNIYVDNVGSVKLGDFSSSLFLRDVRSNHAMRGTLAYIAPEVYRTGCCSEQSDIYSVGLLIYCLFHQKVLPFMDSDSKELAVYKRLAGTAFPKLSFGCDVFGDKIEDLIQKACTFEAGKRIQSFEALKEKLNDALQCAVKMGIGDEILYSHIPPASEVSFAPSAAGAPMAAFPAQACIPGIPVPSVSSAADTNLFDADSLATTVALSEPSSAGEQTVVDLRKVQFSAVAPKTMVKGDYTMIDIVMYEDAFRYTVDLLMKDADEPVREIRSGVLKVQDGAVIRICLTSPDIDIEDNEEVRQWQGDYLEFSFAVFLPERYRKRQILFYAKVYVNDIIAAKLKFIVKCFSFREQKISVSREDVLSAFISYASQDRERVAAIIQGMKKVRPDMDVFFDVDSLRSGEDWEKALHYEIEKRDILFLCWSHFARQSKWVDAEWRYAMEQKGIDCIEPVPIEPPNICPPPDELKQKHFNDKLLYIINAGRTNASMYDAGEKE